MKAIILGYGSIGKRHAKNLEVLGARVVGIHDPDEQAGVPAELVVSGWKDFVDSDTVVVVASSSKYHYRQALDAVAAGAAGVYLEKPPALTLVDVGVIALASEDLGCRVAVGYNWRFHPAGVAWHNMADRVVEVQATAVDDPFDWASLRPGAYLLDQEGGGVVYTSFSHTLDLLVHCFGLVEKLDWTTKRGFGAFASVPTHALVEAKHVSGVRSISNVVWSGPPATSTMIGQLKDGRLMWTDFFADAWKQHTEHLMHRNCLAAFLDWVGGGEPGHLCTIRDAVHTTGVLERVNRVQSSA